MKISKGEVERMDPETKLIVDCATLAGKVMLESNAESYRVEETIERILSTSGLNVTEALTMTTGIIFTLDDKTSSDPPFTVMRRITERSNQLKNIYNVNNISRALTSGTITPQEAYDQLLIVRNSEYSSTIKIIGSTTLVIAFAILLGANSWASLIVALLAGLLVGIMSTIKDHISITNFLHSLLTTAVVSFMIYVVGYSWNLSLTATNIIITASFMPMYPGTSLTNGIRDTMRGDYISGIARVVESVVIALSLALGVAVGLTLYRGVIAWLF